MNHSFDKQYLLVNYEQVCLKVLDNSTTFFHYLFVMIGTKNENVVHNFHTISR